MREIEIKLRVKDLHQIKEKLSERGCVFSDHIRQHDTNYTKGGGTEEWAASKEGDVIIRIRRQNSEAEFNLKQQKSSESDNLEYETKVENPDALHNILVTLGYSPEIEVKKIRRKGKLGEYEICLDEVEKLGSFMEIEKLTSNDADPEEIRKELFDAIEFLGLSREDEETKGYDTQVFLLTHPIKP